MTAPLAVAALRHAIALRSTVGIVVPSDGGSQFRSTAFVRTLENNGRTGSMGRVGACGTTPPWGPLRPAAAQRPGPGALGHPRGPPAGDRHVHRADLSPPTTATLPRTTHTRRVRGTDPRRSRGPTTDPASRPEPGQSHGGSVVVGCGGSVRSSDRSASSHRVSGHGHGSGAAGRAGDITSHSARAAARSPRRPLGRSCTARCDDGQGRTRRRRRDGAVTWRRFDVHRKRSHP